VAKRIGLTVLALIVLLAAATYVAFRVSPWPGALIVRALFDAGSEQTSRALEKYVPAGVASRPDLRYDPGDGDGYVDVYFPASIERTARSLTTIVWIHGGGFVSGNRKHIANYAKVLAAHGFTVASVDYGIAPSVTYPTPVRESAAAVAYLAKNAKELHVDPKRLVFAGDSAGALLAAQLANVVTEPSYAKALGVTAPIERSQLVGMLLYCGMYDAKPFYLKSSGGGPGGGFLTTILWSYSGTKAFATDPLFATASVADYVTERFPATFISAGNGDPLEPQSRAFEAELVAKKVMTDQLFFPKAYAPPAPHEYQFNLDDAAGRLALERSLAFLTGLKPSE
jgi:acetyl esterase/lipase